MLTILAEFIWRRSWLIVLAALLSAAGAAAYSWSSLRLNANLDDLIARDRPYMADYRRFLEEFGDLEYIIVAIDASRDLQTAERAADRLLERLRAIEGLPAVYGTIEPEEQLRIATRAMSDDDLRNLAQAAEGGAIGVLLTADPPHIINEANDALGRLVGVGGAGLTLPRDEAERTGASAVMLLEAIAAARPSSTAASAEGSTTAPTTAPALQNPKSKIQNRLQPSRQYLRSDTGRILFINILPAKDYSTLSVIAEPLAQIRRVIDDVRREYPAVEIGLTGKPVMQFDEMATSNADMTRASIIAIVLCSILFVLMIGGIRRPLLALVAFVIAGAWTYGFATATLGQLNLLSIVFMLVLVGVGLDYGIHVIARYQGFRHEGAGTRDALRGSIVTAVRGNITGALTSSIVFFMALFTSFQGLRELGLIAGGGLILCLIAMSVVLPAMLGIVERRRPADAPRSAPVVGKGVAQAAAEADPWFIRHSRAVLGGAAVVTIALIIAPGGGAKFDFNLLNLQARGLESIEWEHRIIADSSSASWFGAAIADDQQQAMELIAKARQQPTIGTVRSVFDVIRPDSPQRDAWRAALHAKNSPGLARGNDPNDLASTLLQAISRLRTIAQAAIISAPAEAERLAQLVGDLESLDVTHAQTRRSIDAAIASTAGALRTMLEGDRLALRDALPAALRDQFLSRHGQFLVMLHPKADVWEYQPMLAFIADLRAVDPRVTGVPITHFESLGEMRGAFILMSILSLAAIIALLALDFRSWRDVALALVPLGVGILWTVEIMGLLGLSFNLANFFALPMLIGLGVDSAVHILHRYHEGGAGGRDRLAMRHTRRAVILTALTTIIGFGALVIAHHRGLRSLGLVMAIGSTACMLSSIIILPAMLALRERALKAQG